MKEIGPIVRALWRNKTGALLIALQCALTLAIVVNAVFIIMQRIEKMDRPTGLDVDNLISVQSIGFVQNFNQQAVASADLNALRAIPGVVDATPINAVPQSGGGSSTGFRADASDQKKDLPASYYEIDEHGVHTLGLKLIAGRDFRASEMKFLPERTLDYPPVVIISQELAKALFPDGNAVGKTIYSGDKNAYQVVGVVERMQSPWVNWDKHEQTVLLPLMSTEKWMRYMIRTEPGRRDELMPIIEQTLQKLNDGRIIRQLSAHSDVVANAYRSDKGLAITLSVVIALIVLITALGIIGLATFSVNRRTKQIGTRRALGASEIDILRYFLSENFLVTGIGVTLGAAAAVALNIWMVNAFAMSKLQWFYIPIGMSFILLLGLFAVLMPARKAAKISPAIATRTV